MQKVKENKYNIVNFQLLKFSNYPLGGKGGYMYISLFFLYIFWRAGVLATPLLIFAPILNLWEMSRFEPRELP